MHPDVDVQLRYDCLVLAVNRGQDITPNYDDEEVIDLANKFYNFASRGTVLSTNE